MLSGNEKVLDLWNKLASHREVGFMGPQRLNIKDMLEMSDLYDLSINEFERLLILEDKMYPSILKAAQKVQG